MIFPRLRTLLENEDNLKNEKDLKNEDNLKNEDYLKYEDKWQIEFHMMNIMYAALHMCAHT